MSEFIASIGDGLRIARNATQDVFQISRTLTVWDAPAILDAILNLNNAGMDDRKFLLEKLVLLLSRLPSGPGRLGTKVEQFFVDALYKDLAHPPTNFMGPLDTSPSTTPVPKNPKYAFRTDDGSDYNRQFPLLGRAGQPYARTVASSLIPRLPFPDPDVVFDRLLKRDLNAPFKQHPGGLSSMFFAMANLVIHSVFDTRPDDPRINNSPSYISLNPLYGGNAGPYSLPVEKMRKLDGTGKIWEDTFADYRLLFMPPATASILLLLNRNHNYIAENILRENEKSAFKLNLDFENEDQRRAQDDEIFHRSRLVNSAYFAKMVLSDYVGGILGLTRDCSSWRLDLTQTFRRADHEFAPTGEGGAVSIEFNSLYRWHASTSTEDARWIGDVLYDLFKKPPPSITPDDFKSIGQLMFQKIGRDFKKWSPQDFQRGKDNRFSDEQLANAILSATEVPAHSFGAQNIPEVMRIVEVLSIRQGRGWGACSLNEFRKYFGLRPWASFKEWNPDPKVYTAAQELYGHIDDLELYVGLQAEAVKPPMPGAGLCPGYTCSRAILADAVNLVRSDRFLTTEATPFNLTEWGYKYLQVDPNDGSFGGKLSDLLMLHLPSYFKKGNGYAHFPLYVPGTMRGYIAKNAPHLLHNYTWERPGKAGYGDSVGKGKSSRY